MRSRSSSRLGLSAFLMVLLALEGCRDSIAGCVEETCETEDAAAGAGAGAGGAESDGGGGSPSPQAAGSGSNAGAGPDLGTGDPEHSAGAGGAETSSENPGPEPDPGEPDQPEPDPKEPGGTDSGECTIDSECDDGNSCTGEESCIEHVCQAGVPFECPAETPCIDREGQPSCEYPERSPWLVYSGDDAGRDFVGLFGIRSVDIGRASPRNISENIVTEELIREGFLGVAHYTWSPDGRYFFFDALRVDDWMNRVFYTTFGPGLPSPAEPVPELPTEGSWDFGEWSPDSLRLFLTEFATEEVYQVDFTTGSPVTSRHAAARQAFFCAEDVVVYEGTESGSYYFTNRDFSIPAVPIGSGYTNMLLSPARTHLMLEIETEFEFEFESRWWWLRCQPGAALQELEGISDIPMWSPDGRYFAYTVGTTHAVVVEAATGEVAWSAPVDYEQPWSWSETGARLLFSPASQEGEPLTWAIVEFPGRTSTTLSSPEASNSVFAGEHILFYRTVWETSEEKYWLLLKGTETPIFLEGCTSLVVTSPDRRFAACVQELESEHRLLAFELSEGVATPIDLGFGDRRYTDLIITGFSPDGRGLIVNRSAEAETQIHELWWFPASPELAGPFHKINPGDVAHYAVGNDPWQPLPDAP